MLEKIETRTRMCSLGLLKHAADFGNQQKPRSSAGTAASFIAQEQVQATGSAPWLLWGMYPPSIFCSFLSLPEGNNFQPQKVTGVPLRFSHPLTEICLLLEGHGSSKEPTKAPRWPLLGCLSLYKGAFTKARQVTALMTPACSARAL